MRTFGLPAIIRVSISIAAAEGTAHLTEAGVKLGDRYRREPRASILRASAKSCIEVRYVHAMSWSREWMLRAVD